MNLGMNLHQGLRLEQKLAPQMIQAVNILQMNTLELEVAIKEEIETNPLLEVIEHDSDSNHEESGEGAEVSSKLAENEYDAVEQSIWEQIRRPGSKGNDAVRYRIRTKTGNIKNILDKGRLVDTDVYGQIFYVLLIDESNW